MRIALRFAYDGRFPGYARQPEGGTVEDLLIEALGHEGYEAGSWRTGSRTDKGVCATENVAACDLARPHLNGLVPAVNRHLPDGVWLTGAAPVDEGFDPRKATTRTYAYHIPVNGEDVHRLEAACHAFIGEHHMGAFARVEPHRDPVRTVHAFGVERSGDWWAFHVRGHSFLWNQVRRMVDASLAVGQGRADVTDIEDSLASGEPHPQFNVAPPEGLLLQAVHYEPGLAWASEAAALDPRRMLGPRQEARVRAALMESLRD